MKISVDGGALNPKNNLRFGTSVFSENLSSALKLYDKKNQYIIYTFENLKPKIFWLKGRVSLQEFIEKKDVFLAFNQAIPLYTSGKIISFCHGLSYYFYPQYYPVKDYIRLKNQLVEMIKKSDKIIVSSEKIKVELLTIDKSIKEKVVVLPFGIPVDMEAKNVKIKMTNLPAGRQGDKYFLFVANNQQIKNVEFVIDSFIKSKLKEQGYKLFLIGNWGEFEDKKEAVISMGNISRPELKKLYQQAVALLTSSFYESFNFPVLEALAQKCPVIGLKSAIIPELESFVNLAKNKSQFIDLIKLSTSRKLKVIDQRIIQKQFSWKSYVNNLVKLYK